MECVDIEDSDYFATLVLPNGDLKSDLKVPVEDEQIYAEVMKVWGERGDKTVLFTVQKACGKEKIISARTTN